MEGFFVIIEVMGALFFTAAIIITILGAFALGKKIFNSYKKALIFGGSATAFWLFWTFGFSTLIVGYAITGPLAIFQTILIITIFTYSYLKLKKDKKQKDLINEKDEDIEKKDMKIDKLEKDLEESEDMKKKIVDYYEGPEDKNKRSFIKIPIIGSLTVFFERLFRR